MQISTANLLASQTQSLSRPRTAAFEPIAFKEASPAVAKKPAATIDQEGEPAAPAAGTGAVRPGTNLDITV